MELPELESLAENLPCVCRRRVLYGEVDRMDLVYGSHYLTWFEHGRNEYLRLCGLPYTGIERRGLRLPVIESRVWHRAPIRYDQLVEIHCAIVAVSKASATFAFRLVCEGVAAAAGYTVHACLDDAGRPCRLPDWLSDATLRRFDLSLPA
jgi:acyl-CoA thioester hydrolase